MIKDKVVFLKEFFSAFETTGTFCPTGKWAAQALASPIKEFKGPRRILEVGAGTGSVTKVLLKQMRDDDQLTVCEINPSFMKQLKQMLLENEDFILNKDRVSFFEGPVQEMPSEQPYDAIICALPFNNFDVETTDAIFSKLFQLSNGHTLMSYFEYIGLRKLAKVSPIPKRRIQISGVEKYLSDNCYPRLVRRIKIWPNILPIYVYLVNMSMELPKTAVANG